MKKTVSIVLILALLMGMAALAEPYVLHESDKFTVTAEAPENYDFILAGYGDFTGGLFAPDDAAKPYYTLLIAYSEEYADTFGKDSTLNDLTPEQLIRATMELTSQYSKPEVTTATTDFGTLCIIVNEQGSESEYASILTIYHGYFIEVYIDMLNGEQLSEEDIQKGLDIMSSLELIEK